MQEDISSLPRRLFYRSFQPQSIRVRDRPGIVDPEDFSYMGVAVAVDLVPHVLARLVGEDGPGVFVQFCGLAPFVVHLPGHGPGFYRLDVVSIDHRMSF